MKGPGLWITIGKRGFNQRNLDKLVNEYNPSGIRINAGRSTHEWVLSALKILNDLHYDMSNVYVDIGNQKKENKT